LALFSATIAFSSAAVAQDDFDDDFGRPPAPSPEPVPTDDDPFGESPRETEAPPDAGESSDAAPSADPLEESTEGSTEKAGEPREAAAKKERRRGEGRVLDDEDPARRRRFLRHNTIYGPVGGIHVVDAGTG